MLHLVCEFKVSARYDGAQLPELSDKTNTASGVWADTAYRSKKNQKHLKRNGLVSHIHDKKHHRLRHKHNKNKDWAPPSPFHP